MFKNFLLISFFCKVNAFLLIASDLPADRINLAIRRSLDQMYRLHEDSTSIIPVVRQLNDSTWQSGELPWLDYEKLPELLQQAFEVYKIQQNYHVTIKSCVDLAILLGYSQFDLAQSDPVPCQGRERPDSCMLLEIQFYKSKAKFKITNSWSWVFLCSILLVFGGLVFWNKFLRKKMSFLKKETRKDIFEFGQTQLNLNTSQLIGKNTKHKLTYREAKLMQYFVENQGKILERDTILQAVWGEEEIQVSRSLDVFVSRLRKLIQDDPMLEISTIHGIGYRLDILTPASKKV